VKFEILYRCQGKATPDVAGAGAGAGAGWAQAATRGSATNPKIRLKITSFRFMFPS